MPAPLGDAPSAASEPTAASDASSGSPDAMGARGRRRSAARRSRSGYQHEAAEVFVAGGVHGIVALTCGAGKTFVGMAAMARVGESTLVLCSSTTGARYGITFTRATLLRPNPPPNAITKVGV